MEETGDGFIAHLEPWWASTSPVSGSYHEETPFPGSPTGHPTYIILAPVYDSGLLDISPETYTDLGYLDYHEILDELGLSRWRPILEAFCSDCHEPTDPSYSDHSGVQIGPRQAVGDTQQVGLTSAGAD
ncbi:hypothetical protein [Haloarcula rubripromontorii]|uniref:hypothetical protein n=1 Tax=Haloarcula rubripromontorii TaxID=1705562 RepID=UPI001F10F4C6|nr:hypothetical protein [Haloarcula rubripromontorii]